MLIIIIIIIRSYLVSLDCFLMTFLTFPTLSDLCLLSGVTYGITRGQGGFLNLQQYNLERGKVGEGCGKWVDPADLPTPQKCQSYIFCRWQHRIHSGYRRLYHCGAKISSKVWLHRVECASAASLSYTMISDVDELKRRINSEQALWATCLLNVKEFPVLANHNRHPLFTQKCSL